MDRLISFFKEYVGQPVVVILAAIVGISAYFGDRYLDVMERRLVVLEDSVVTEDDLNRLVKGLSAQDGAQSEELRRESNESVHAAIDKLRLELTRAVTDSADRQAAALDTALDRQTSQLKELVVANQQIAASSVSSVEMSVGRLDDTLILLAQRVDDVEVLVRTLRADADPLLKQGSFFAKYGDSAPLWIVNAGEYDQLLSDLKIQDGFGDAQIYKIDIDKKVGPN